MLLPYTSIKEYFRETHQITIRKSNVSNSMPAITVSFSTHRDAVTDGNLRLVLVSVNRIGHKR